MNNPFISAADFEAFLAFRRSIELGKNHKSRLFIDATESCPARGHAMAKWIADLTVSPAEFFGLLAAGLAGDPAVELVLPFTSFVLPGGRGRLLIMAGALPESGEERAAIVRQVKSEQAAASGRWWVVWILTAAGLRPPDRSQGVVVKLAPDIL